MPYYYRRDKKSLTDYAFLWDVMQENIKNENTKEKPLFTLDGNTVKCNPKNLKEIALRAVDENVLINLTCKQITSDASNTSLDTSTDTNTTQQIVTKMTLFDATCHLDMKNIVITVSDEAVKFMEASMMHGKTVTVTTPRPMPVERIASSENLSDNSEIVDQYAFLDELIHVPVRQSSETRQVHNKIGYSRVFTITNTTFDVRAQVNIELEFVPDCNVTAAYEDEIRCNIVRVCEETIENIQQSSALSGGKRKREPTFTGPEDRPLKKLKTKAKCGCSIF